MKRVLKNELRQLMQAAPPLPDAAKKAQLIEQARSKRLSLSTETSMLQFIKGQIRFVNKKPVCLSAFVAMPVWTVHDDDFERQ